MRPFDPQQDRAVRARHPRAGSFGPDEDPWTVQEAAWPASGPAEDRLRFLLRYAILAPSSHNTQPWRFGVHDAGVDVFSDPARALPVVDPDERELIVSCGAAIFHLRVAAARFGWTARVVPFPAPKDPTLLARVELAPGPPDPALAALLPSIPRRHTARIGFEPRALDPELVGRLRAAARAEGAWLEVVEEIERRRAVARLVAWGDKAQSADPGFRHELARWLRPNHPERRDGIPGYALGLSDVAARVGPMVVRTFDLGKGHAARDLELAESSPALLVLGTALDGRCSWLAAGQALAHVLLRLTAEGAVASFLNQPIEVPRLRPTLTSLVGATGAAQLLLRAGYGPPGPATPRRPLTEVLIRT